MSSALERWFDRKQVAPFRDLSLLHEPFDRLFNEFLNFKRGDVSSEIGFMPSCDISEDASRYIMKFDLPGVKKDQVKVEADNNQITVRAERKEERSTNEMRRHLSEVYYGSYVRTFALPSPIDEKRVDAKFDNGVLTVIVPKTESMKAHQIPVH